MKKRILSLIIPLICLSMALNSYAATSSPGTGDGEIEVKGLIDVTDYRREEYLKQAGVDPNGKYSVTILQDLTTEENKDAVLIYTHYRDRTTIISDESKGWINEAYAEIQAAGDDLSVLTPEVTTVANQAGIPVEDLYVVQVYDLTYYEIDPDYWKSHNHGEFWIKLKFDNIQGFVMLLHRDKGVWEVVDQARITEGTNDTIEFPASSLSPFAIVVSGKETAATGTSAQSGIKSPKTGDNTWQWMLGGSVAGIVLIGAAYILLIKRKEIFR